MVAGAMALCFEAAPRPLTATEARTVLLTTTEPPTSHETADRYGAGYLDISRAVATAAASAQTTNISTMPGPHSIRRPLDNSEVRDMKRRIGVHKDSTEQNLALSVDPDTLYRELVYNPSGAMAEWIGQSFAILAGPGECPQTPLEAGDYILRVALGELGLGHLAVLSDSTLTPQETLGGTHIEWEKEGPGLYSTVIEGDAFPHTRSDRFARRVLDQTGCVPLGQMLLRQKLTRGSDQDLAGPQEDSDINLLGRTLADAQSPTLSIGESIGHSEVLDAKIDVESGAGLVSGDFLTTEESSEVPGHVQRARARWRQLREDGQVPKGVRILDLAAVPSLAVARFDYQAWTNSADSIYVAATAVSEPGLLDATLYHESRHIQQFRRDRRKPPDSYEKMMKYERDAYAESVKWLSRRKDKEVRRWANSMHDGQMKFEKQIADVEGATTDAKDRENRYKSYLITSDLLPWHTNLKELYAPVGEQRNPDAIEAIDARTTEQVVSLGQILLRQKPSRQPDQGLAGPQQDLGFDILGGTLTEEQPSTPSPRLPPVMTTPATALQGQGVNITVNPESKLTARDIQRLLRNQNVPESLRQSVHYDNGSKIIRILAPGRSGSKEPSWIEDLRGIGGDWEVTTGRLVFIVSQGMIKGQEIKYDLLPEEEVLLHGQISDNVVSHSSAPDPTLAKTIPSPNLADKGSSTHFVKLDSGRGLVAIVTQIVASPGPNQFTKPPIDVPTSVIAWKLIHELSAHAGRFSLKKPANHGNAEVEANVKQVDILFQKDVANPTRDLMLKVLRHIAAAAKEGSFEKGDSR